MTNLCSHARAVSIFTAIPWSACSTTNHLNSRVRHVPSRLYYFLLNVMRAAKNPPLAGLIKKPLLQIVSWYARIVQSPC